MMNLITAKTAGLMSFFLLGLLCAAAQGQSPLIVGNSRAFEGPIVTTNFPTGPTVGFVPDGAKTAPFTNGRGVLVVGNNLYYTELVANTNRPPEGPTDAIHIAPFNGGNGGSDTGTLSNPRPGCGVQDLAYHDGFIYALTGFNQVTLPSCTNLQVFKIAVGGTAWSGPVTIQSASTEGVPTTADGFTILEWKPFGRTTFLINDRGLSCTYREYDSQTGAFTGNGFVVSGYELCAGVDTLDTEGLTKSTTLYISTGDGFTIAAFSLSSSWVLTPGLDFTPGDGWAFVEDISLVHGFVGKPGSASCHGKSVSELAQTFGGANAASALGYASVSDLQDAIRAFCGR
jgi:hypothetical protein